MSDEDKTVVSSAPAKNTVSRTVSSRPAAAANDFPPEIGKYKVLGVIAKGGMGIVYRAIHPSLKRYVVIKKMTARNKSGNAERFKKEAQILLDLQSPYIVHLFDYFTEGGYRYMVEELVDGLALDNLIKKQVSLPVPVAMLLMQDTCYALKYAHSKNIVHRDIKPGNILISKRGEIKLADFGIASDSENDSITQTGTSLGTPSYMPPEQWEDSAHVTKTADIYALGIMLYEMLTGTKPYPGTFSIETLKTIKKGKYIKASKIEKSVPKEIDKLIAKMIQPKAKRRYQNIEAVIKVVKKYLKHYDTHELRVQLAKSVITSKNYEYENLAPVDKKRRFIRRIVISVVCACLACFGLWKSGLVHHYILRHWYKPVVFDIKTPASKFNQMDLPLKITFYENDEKDIPYITGSTRNLNLKGTKLYEYIYYIGRKVQKDNSSSCKTYTMLPVWLKKGEYRAKIVVGPYVWWKDFTVGEETFIYEADFFKNLTRPLHIHMHTYDAVTMESLDESTTVKINYKNKWVDLSEIPEEDLHSATVWKIRATCEGYEDKYYSLLIDWYQDELYLSAALIKK